MSAGPTHLSDRERFDWLRLSRCENVGPRTFAMLLRRYGGASAALKALPDLAKKNANGRVLRLAAIADIEAEFEAADRCGARFIGWSEPDYPWLLREIDSAPPMIAIRGNPIIFTRPSAAIVGSRNASAAGLAFTERLARGLAEAGYVVVSGLARGIDARAHRATIEAGTIAVLAGGHDRIYPADHEKLLDQLLDKGAAVSEMPFGWEARGRDFPRRNRIVSGLSSGIVVVEAAKNSGSLITARFAGEQGREVFAVPGSPLDPRAEGTNALLRDGATFCTRVDDVLDTLAARLQAGPRGDLFSEPGSKEKPEEPLWDELDLDEGLPAASVPETRPGESDSAIYGSGQGPDEGSAEAKNATGAERVIGLLGPSPVSIDELVRAADMPAQAIRAILLELELEGRLERHGGNLVSRVWERS
jgi:DNA processing protein